VEGRHYLQNVISNTGWQFADNILRMSVGLVVGIWIARYLGPKNFGLLNYAIAFVSLFAPLATLGLDDIVVRDLVHDPTPKNEIIGTAFILKLTGSIAAVLTAVLLVFALRPTDTMSHWLVGILSVSFLFQVFNIVECWFNSQVNAKTIILAKSVSFIICSLTRIFLIVTEASLLAFALISVIEVVISSIGLVVAYKLKGSLFSNLRFTSARAKILIKDSWPLLFSIISIVVYQRIDQVMLQEMVGSTEVGIYSVAVRMSEVWAFIPSVIYWSVYPSILEARQTSDDLFYERLQKYYNLMALLSYAIAIPVTLIAQWLVPTLFGEAYSRAGLMLIILIWANMFTGLEIARTAFLNAMNLNRIYLAAIFAGGVLNIVLNLFLIPKFGGLGASYASLVSYWFAAHGSCFFSRSLYKTGRMMAKAMVYPRIW
jgi:O-antigen/teichoic acid export membrane protein